MAHVNGERGRFLVMEWAQAHVPWCAADSLQANVLADGLYDVDGGLELLDEIHFRKRSGELSYSDTLE